MRRLNNIDDVLIDSLKDIYSVECYSINLLQKMINAAHNPSLVQILKSHLLETEVHVERLNKVSSYINAPVTGKHCRGFCGLRDEAENSIKQATSMNELSDLILIGALIRIEHYEIASYTHAICIAQQAGKIDVVDLLDSTLEEECIAENNISSICDLEILPKFGSSKSENVYSFEAFEDYFA